MCTSCAPDHAGHLFYSTAAAAADVRRALTQLMDETPLWQAPGADAKAGGAGAAPPALRALADLIERLGTLLRGVADKAEEARSRIAAARGAALLALRPPASLEPREQDQRIRARAAVERAHRDALAEIGAAEAAKLAALGIEAERAGAARDRLCAEVAALRAALDALTDVEVVALSAVLPARLRALLDALGAAIPPGTATDLTLEALVPADLPPPPLSPSAIGSSSAWVQSPRDAEAAAAAATAAVIRQAPVVAPPRFLVVAAAVSVGDIELQVHTRGGRVVSPGDPVAFGLRLTDTARARAVAPLASMLATLAAHAEVSIVMLPPGFRRAPGSLPSRPAVPVPYTLAFDDGNAEVLFRCIVPAATAGGGRLVFAGATVHGRPIAGTPLELPTASLSAADVVLSGFGPGLTVSAGAEVRAALRLTPAARALPGFCSHSALAFLAARTRVDASVATRRSSATTPVAVAVEAADPAAGDDAAVHLSVRVPATFMGGAVLTIAGVWVDGRPVRGPPFAIDVLSREAEAAARAAAAAAEGAGAGGCGPVLVRVLLGLPSVRSGAGRVRTAADFAALADLAARTRASGEATPAPAPPPRQQGLLRGGSGGGGAAAAPLPLLPGVAVDVRTGAVAVSFAIPPAVVFAGGAVDVSLGLPPTPGLLQ